jgi:aldose 1-epimerase
MAPSLESRDFGSLPDGRSVEAWTLRAGSMEVEILTYGGIVSRLLAPDREGELADVVLGFGEIGGYLSDHPFFGATVGRVAGRITDGTFELEGKTYDLPINDPPNHLHGGTGSIDSRLWKAEPVERSDAAASLRLSLHSVDGDHGYPGDVELIVIYTLTDSGQFVFETEARSSCATPVSLTHHSYFNLGGEGSGDVLDHELQIDSERSFLADEKMTLLDKPLALDGQPGDFRVGKRLGDAVPDLWQRHGDLYWLGEADACRPVATLRHSGSGRVLKVATNHDCIQMYTGVGLDGSHVGKAGSAYEAFGGVCLECEGYPNAIGASAKEGFGDIVVRPDSPQKYTTIYSFDAEG